jgi:hypothetical protein
MAWQGLDNASFEGFIIILNGELIHHVIVDSCLTGVYLLKG